MNQLLALLQSDLGQLPKPVVDYSTSSRLFWRVPMPGESSEYSGIGLHNYTRPEAQLDWTLACDMIREALHMRSLGFSAESLAKNLRRNLPNPESPGVQILLPDEPLFSGADHPGSGYVPALLSRAISYIASENDLPYHSCSTGFVMETPNGGKLGLERGYWVIDGERLSRDVFYPAADELIETLLSRKTYAVEVKYNRLLQFWKLSGYMTPDVQLAMRIARFCWPREFYKMLSKIEKGQ